MIDWLLSLPPFAFATIIEVATIAAVALAGAILWTVLS